jgi:hypothetical protein
MRALHDESNAEGRRQKLEKRLGHSLEPGDLEFCGYRFTIVKNSGLLRLGRLALAVMSYAPEHGWVNEIVKGTVAEAIMDYPDKYHLFAWVLRSMPECTWSDVGAEVDRLIQKNHVVASQAAFRLLSSHGSEQAARFLGSAN